MPNSKRNYMLRGAAPPGATVYLNAAERSRGVRRCSEARVHNTPKSLQSMTPPPSSPKSIIVPPELALPSLEQQEAVMPQEEPEQEVPTNDNDTLTWYDSFCGGNSSCNVKETLLLD